MPDHAGLIERTRHARITPATAAAMQARQYRCHWCGRPAMRGHPWCKRHQPGLARERNRDRRKPEAIKQAGARMRVIITECGLERVLTPELEAWPPIARILAHRPRHTRPVMLADVVPALLALAMDDPKPWAAVVHRMRDTGIMRDTDKGFVGWHARHGKTQRQRMTSSLLCAHCAA